MKSRKSVVCAIVALAVVGSLFSLHGTGFAAEKFPSREITIVVPFAPGGGVDLPTRVLAEYLKKEMNAPVVVENRAEAAGVKGVMDVYRAKPDGYTLLATLFPRIAQTEVAYKAPYKILEFTYLGVFQKQDEVLVVRKDSPYQSMSDLANASKKSALTCSISSPGGLADFFARLLMKTGMGLKVVPFKGSAPAMMALIGGNADLNITEESVVLEQREKLRILGIFADERSPRFPGVPTFKELGYNMPVMYPLTGISGPPRLPKEVADVLSGALAKAIKNPEVMARIEKIGTIPVYMNGQQFRAVAESMYKAVSEHKDVFEEKK